MDDAQIADLSGEIITAIKDTGAFGGPFEEELTESAMKATLTVLRERLGEED